MEYNLVNTVSTHSNAVKCSLISCELNSHINTSGEKHLCGVEWDGPPVWMTSAVVLLRFLFSFTPSLSFITLLKHQFPVFFCLIWDFKVFFVTQWADLWFYGLTKYSVWLFIGFSVFDRDWRDRDWEFGKWWGWRQTKTTGWKSTDDACC